MGYFISEKLDKEELKREGEIKEQVWKLKMNPNATLKDLVDIYYPKKESQSFTNVEVEK